MRTLKISIVATVAAMLAWWFRFPHRIWPAHPQFADFLLALILGLVLQFTWADAKSIPESKAKKKNGDPGQSPQKL
jgi:hypothetical protein